MAKRKKIASRSIQQTYNTLCYVESWVVMLYASGIDSLNTSLEKTSLYPWMNDRTTAERTYVLQGHKQAVSQYTDFAEYMSQSYGVHPIRFKED